MAIARLSRAGTILLVLWLTADVAAYGFCTPPLPHAPTATSSMDAGDCDGSDGTPDCCGAHHCFCCSTSIEGMTFELPIDAHAAIIAPSPQTRPADISVANTSPPPRF
jgi:hypothetical protein